MKILLLGKNGQVGWELQRSLAPLGKLVALDRHSREFCGDLADLTNLAETVRRLRPDVIVNAAAYTGVDQAELHGDMAHAVNALAPQLLAREAQRIGAWLVHYSTDYVFNGAGNDPWTEDDIPAPLNIYGKTKLDGEQLISANCEKYLIFRTSWVYGLRGNNFAKKILKLAVERDQLKVIDDQIGAPTGADLIADVTAHAVYRAIQSSSAGDSGIYHLAAKGEISWHGYADWLVGRALEMNMPLKVTRESIHGVPTGAFPQGAVRPHNSRLDTGKLALKFGLVMPDWRDGLVRTFQELAMSGSQS